MARRLRGLAVLVAVVFMASGCFGSFNATRNLWKWNRDVHENQWAQEGVFLLLSWLPAYTIAGLLDVIVINSIEFWTGENPFPYTAMTEGEKVQVSRVVDGDTELIVEATLRDGQPMMILSKLESGVLVDTAYITQRDGMAVLENAASEVLASAIALPDGGMLLRDAHGEQVAFFYGNEVSDFFQGELKAEKVTARIDVSQTTQTAMVLR